MKLEDNNLNKIPMDRPHGTTTLTTARLTLRRQTLFSSLLTAAPTLVSTLRVSSRGARWSGRSALMIMMAAVLKSASPLCGISEGTDMPRKHWPPSWTT